MNREVCVFTLAFANLMFAEENTPKDPLQILLEIRWGGIFTTSNPIKEFSNIPASYRTVPLHPDDGGLRNLTATISDTTLNPARAVTMHYTGGVGLMFKERLALRANIGFNAMEYKNLKPGNGGSIRSIDISSKKFERGPGTSLVYNSLQTKGLASPKPFISPEVEIRVGPVGFLAGFTQKKYEYIIQRGYDRYNSLNKLDDLPFANVTTQHFYGGIRLAYIGALDNDPETRTTAIGFLFTVGPAVQKINFAPAAQGTQVQSGTGLMFNMSIAFSGPVKRFKK